MANHLVIVESPAKAKTIGKFLGKNYKVEASMGHVRDLPKSQMGINVEENFEPKYITIRGKGELINKLKKAAKNADKIFLATDPDREGEAISWHLQHILKIDSNQLCRITFNEITKDAVKSAIKQPRIVDMHLVDAQQTRRVLDRIVGYNISPLLWKKVKKGLSAGRVQSVALRIICDREEEIRAFEQEEYWTIDAVLTGDERHQMTARLDKKNNEKIKISSEKEVKQILSDIKEGLFSVESIKKNERKKTAPESFTTSTLQQEAAKKLNFSTKKTMMIAQQLYEGVDIEKEGTVGLVTYIRTDSTRISDEAKEQVKEYIQTHYGKDFVDIKAPKKQKGKSKTQDAHEGIRPTSVFRTPESIKDSLSRDQYRLYKLVWSRFVASQMKDAIFDTVSIKFNIAEYQFKTTGSSLKYKGFYAVHIEHDDEELVKGEKFLPVLTEGQTMNLIELKEEQHFTQPPTRYNEASLVKTLEELGIGRPSTYAPTIATILQRGYVQKVSKQIEPTELGEAVNDIMKDFFKDIVDVEFTAHLEEQLDEIEEGKKEWKDVIKIFYQSFEQTLKVAEEHIEHIEIRDELTDIACELCGKPMAVKFGKFGKFLACSGFPECRNTKPLYEETDHTCPKCGGKIYIKKSKKGKKYFGCENNPTCDFMSWNEPTNIPCPSCGNFLEKKENKKGTMYLCNNEECGYKTIEKSENV